MCAAEQSGRTPPQTELDSMSPASPSTEEATVVGAKSRVTLWTALAIFGLAIAGVVGHFDMRATMTSEMRDSREAVANELREQSMKHEVKLAEVGVKLDGLTGTVGGLSDQLIRTQGQLEARVSSVETRLQGEIAKLEARIRDLEKNR